MIPKPRRNEKFSQLIRGFRSPEPFPKKRELVPGAATKPTAPIEDPGREQSWLVTSICIVLVLFFGQWLWSLL